MKLLRTAVITAIFSMAVPLQASAQKYNGSVANPFQFCSLPKPCKHCHPWRSIYNDICAGQQNTGKGQTVAPVANSAIIETVDQDGKKWYFRTVDGYTLRSTSRPDLEDENLNSDRPVEGLEVISGPSDARLMNR